MKKHHWLLLAAVLGFIPALLAGPAAATNSESTIIHAKGEGSCDSSEWHWVITSVASEGQAPATITVTFDNGAWVVPLDAYTGHTAHYRLSSNLSAAYIGAATVIYADWDGQFNLSHGPCAPPVTTIPSTTIPVTTTAPTTTLPVTTTAPSTTVGPTTSVAPTTAQASASAPSTTIDPAIIASERTALPRTGVNSLALAGLANALICTGAWLSLRSRKMAQL